LEIKKRDSRSTNGNTIEKRGSSTNEREVLPLCANNKKIKV